MIQAANPNATVETIEYLTRSILIMTTTPNRIRAVSGGLSNNPENTWGFGVAHFINLCKNIWTRKTPILGSRLLQVLSQRYTLAEPQRTQVQQALQALRPKVKSKNVSETLNSMLSV